MKKLRGSTSTASSSFSGGGEASTHPSQSQAPRIKKDRKELDKARREGGGVRYMIEDNGRQRDVVMDEVES